jgi:hypothetical protein
VPVESSSMRRFSVPAAVAFGVIGAMFLWAWFALWLYSLIVASRDVFSATQLRIIRISTTLTAGAGFVPAFLLSIVAGGNIGGGYGEALLGTCGVPMGLTIGIILTFNVSMTVASLTGLLLGTIVAVAWRHAAA